MKRLTYIDQVSGLLIAYMIVGHTLQFCGLDYFINSPAYQTLQFFMFWFFFKSGMFFKERKFKEILQGGGKLVVPFVIWTLAGHIFNCIRLYLSGDYNWVHYVLSPFEQILLRGSAGGNMPLWFLLSLLFVQLIYSALHNKMRDEWIVVLAFLSAFVSYKVIHIPLYVGNVSLGLLVYAVGHCMKKYQFRNWVFAFSSIAYIVIFCVYPSFIGFWTNSLEAGSYPLAVLFDLSGCVVLNNAFGRLSFKLNVLEYIGVRSMPFYVMHWLVIGACCKVYEILGFSGWTLFSAIIISCIIILPVMEKLLLYFGQGWVFGIKNKTTRTFEHR